MTDCVRLIYLVSQIESIVPSRNKEFRVLLEAHQLHRREFSLSLKKHEGLVRFHLESGGAFYRQTQARSLFRQL